MSHVGDGGDWRGRRSRRGREGRDKRGREGSGREREKWKFLISRESNIMLQVVNYQLVSFDVII